MAAATTTDLIPSTQSDDEEEEVLKFLSIARNIWLYVSPIILICGTIGNVFCFITLVKLVRQKKTFALYFMVLAVSDIVYLNTGLMRQWVRVLTGTDIRETNLAVCKIHTFVVHWTSHLSSWLLVAATVQRLCSVVLPLKARDIFTSTNIWISMLVIGACLAAVDATMFWTEGDVFDEETNITYKCTYLDKHEFYVNNVFPWMDLMLLVVIPFLIMLISNIFIIRTVCKTTRIRRTMSQNNGRGGRRTTNSMTAMMLTTSFAFLFLMFPLAISLTFINDIVPEGQEEPLTEAKIDVAWAVVSVLAYTNNAINFLLYCISGELFRRTLLSYCCKKYRDPIRRASTIVYSIDTKCGVQTEEVVGDTNSASQPADTDIASHISTETTITRL